MPDDPSAIDLPIGVFILLRDLIRERIGVYYDDDKRELLASRLGSRITTLELRTFLNYYYFLKYGPQPEVEWVQVTDALSVQETFFWREFEQIRTLVIFFIPQ